jgi:hypothetical protein
MPENRGKTGQILTGEATRFKSGQSGNPGGRPKTVALSQACRELLGQPVPDDPEGRSYAEAIAQMLGRRAIEARQTIEIQSMPLREAFERMSREELDAYAREGSLPAWFQRTAEVNREQIQ